MPITGTSQMISTHFILKSTEVSRLRQTTEVPILLKIWRRVVDRHLTSKMWTALLLRLLEGMSHLHLLRWIDCSMTSSRLVAPLVKELRALITAREMIKNINPISLNRQWLLILDFTLTPTITPSKEIERCPEKHRTKDLASSMGSLPSGFWNVSLSSVTEDIQMLSAILNSGQFTTREAVTPIRGATINISHTTTAPQADTSILRDSIKRIVMWVLLRRDTVRSLDLTRRDIE